MKIIQTTNQKKAVDQLTQHDVLQELSKRSNLQLFQAAELYQLELKERGLAILIEVIEKHSNDDWVVLSNICLDSALGPIHCDLLLITNTMLYSFTINTTEITHKHQEKTLNYSSELPHALYKVTNIYECLNQIFDESVDDINIQSYLAYVSPTMFVEVECNAPTIKIIDRNSLVPAVKKIAHKEKNSSRQSLDKQAVINIIEDNEIKKPLELTPISVETKSNLQKGICCSTCYNFNVSVSQHYISCECGCHEALEEAILRTMCEYGVLYFDEELQISNLVNFFAGQVSALSVIGVINKFMTQ